MTDGLVSILMAARNAEAFIAQAIESCRAQSYEDWELLVVDDASTDGTVSVVERYAHDPRIRLLRLSTNAGPGPARNIALREAKGRWLTVLDADDLFHEKRLEVLIRYATQYGSDHAILDGMLRWELMEQPPASVTAADLQTGPVRTWALSEWFGQGRGGKPFFDADHLADARVRQSDTRAAEDTVFLVRLVAFRNLRLLEVPEQTYVYRRTPGSLVTRTTKRLDEERRAFELLEREFAGYEGLHGAIRGRLDANRLEAAMLSARLSLRAGRPLAALRALRTKGLGGEVLRRVPAWFASRRRIRERRRAQARLG